jgi:hypothetical protein
MRPLFPAVFSLACLVAFASLRSEPAQALPPVVAVAQHVAADTSSERCGLGPLQGLPTLFNSSVLTTDPVKVTLPTTSSATVCIKVKITNPSTTATISWKTVVAGATAPLAANMTANYASTGASPILPGAVEIITLQPNRDLYVVASAAASSVNATSFLFE